MNQRLSAKPLLIFLALMIGLALFIQSSLNVIPSIPATASDNLFSGERAKNSLTQLIKEQTPHPVDSKQNRIVEQRLVSQLRAMGYQEEIQDTTLCRDYDRGFSRCTRVRNVIVEIAGTSTEKTGILLAAHYDSVNAGPGASDAGSAVGTLLEVARLLSKEPRPKNTIVLLFNEGEEFGLFGARAFMQEHPLAKKLKLAINVEARGTDGKSVMFETGENSGWLVDEYIKTTPSALSSSLFYEVYKVLPNDTDLTVFKEFGLQGLNFAHGGMEPHYHTPLDNLENLKLGTIQHHGDNVWGVLKNIKDKDLTNLEENNIVYTDVIGLFVLKWQESTSLIVSVLLFILFVLAAKNLLKNAELNGKSIRTGVYSFFSVLILSVIGALAVQKGTQALSGNPTPWHANNLPMQLTLWSLLTWLALVVGRWLTKTSQALNVFLGILICWLVLGVATSWLVVGISFLFIVPSFIAVVLLLLYPTIKTVLKDKTLATTLLVSAFSAAVIFMPIVYVLELMVGYRMTVAIGVMYSFILSAFVPLLAIHDQNKKIVKGISHSLLTLFVIGFAWTIGQSPYSAEVPQALNLTHVQQADGQSILLAGTPNNKPQKQLKNQLGDTQTSTVFPWSSVSYLNKQTKNSNIAPIKSEIISSEVANGKKSIVLSLSTDEVTFRDALIYIPSDSGLTSITYQGHKQSFEGETPYLKDYFALQCRGESCQTINLSLVFNQNKPVEIYLAKTLSGVPDSDQPYVKNRGEAATQRQFGDRTIVLSTLSL